MKLSSQMTHNFNSKCIFILHLQVENWKVKYPQDLFFFRPQNKAPTTADEDLEVDNNIEDDMFYSPPHLYNKKDDSTLLFIHQSHVQMHILRR